MQLFFVAGISCGSQCMSRLIDRCFGVMAFVIIVPDLAQLFPLSLLFKAYLNNSVNSPSRVA